MSTSEFDNEEDNISDDQWAIDINETDSKEAPAASNVSIDIENDSNHVDTHPRVSYFAA